MPFADAIQRRFEPCPSILLIELMMLHTRNLPSLAELGTPWSVTTPSAAPRTSGDFCLVVALTADDRAVMLKHRHPSRLAFPGTPMIPGEEIEVAARRVLLESADFACDEIRSLGVYVGLNIVYATGAGLAALPRRNRPGHPARLLAPFGQLSHWVGADGFNAAPHALALGLATMHRARFGVEKVELAQTSLMD